jgi:hypothetical protein
MTVCSATKLDGTPCRCAAGANGLCCFHDPAILQRAADARVGKRPKRGQPGAPHRVNNPPAPPFALPDLAPPASPDQLPAWLLQIAGAVIEGRLDHRLANTAIRAAEASVALAPPDDDSDLEGLSAAELKIVARGEG